MDAVTRLAAVAAERLDEPWRWPGSDGQALTVRDLCLRLIESELIAAARSGRPPTEAVAALAGVQAAWGELRGMIAGLSEADISRDPGNGEWPLGAVLTHVLTVELRYRAHCLHALNRRDTDPLYINPDVGPVADGGDAEAWIGRIEQARRQTDAQLAGLSDADLARRAVWAGHGVDVRFRLTRFAGHLLQHAIHAGKVLQALHGPPSEPRLLAIRLSTARGRHEHVSPGSVLRDLDRAHARILEALT